MTGTAGGLTVQPATLTIADDDDTPKVELVLDPASISELGGVATVTARLDRLSSVETRVTVSATTGGTAATRDFDLSEDVQLTIAAGQRASTETVTVTANDNDVYETGKRVTVSGLATNTLGIEQPETVALEIDEDDAASTKVTLSLDETRVSEGVGTAGRRLTVTASLDRAARPEAVNVAVSVGGGTAVSGADYTAVQDFVVTIAAGDREGMETFDLIPLADETDEPNRTIRVRATASGLTVAPAAGLTVTIVDDDDVPQVELELTAQSIPEAGGETAVTARLAWPSSEATRVVVTASPTGHATADDFTQSGTVLTIPAGHTDSTGTVRIEARGNVVAENDKSISIGGVATNDQGVVQPATTTLTITDDERVSTKLTLTLTKNTVTEGSGAVKLEAIGTLDAGARPDDIEVTFQVSGATAVAGEDFAVVPDKTFTMAGGEREFTVEFDLTVLDDTTHEAPETVTITATTVSGTNATGLTVVPTTLTIEDNDLKPEASLVLTPDSIPENGGSSTVTAVLNRASSEATEVTVSVSPVLPATGNDFRQNGTVLTIPAGDTDSTGTVTVTGVDNNTVGLQRVTVRGTAENELGVTQPAAQTLTISDDDVLSTSVTLQISPATVAESATGQDRTVTVQATLNGAVRNTDTIVPLTVAGGTAEEGADFDSVAAFSVTIDANSVSGMEMFTLAPVDDEIDESNEVVRVTAPRTVDGLAVSPTELQVVIQDNDAAPRVTLELTEDRISEEGGQTAVTARLEGRLSSEPTRVLVSATPVSPAVDADFRLSGSVLTIAAGATESTGTVTVRANGNETFTGDKEVAVSGTATNAVGIVQPPITVLTIEDNDLESTKVTLTATPEEIRENRPGRVTLTAMLDGAARERDTELTVTVTDGTAIAGTDYAAVPEFRFTIPAKARSANGSFLLRPLDNDVSEADRTVLVRATTPGLTVDPAGGLAVTIADDEPAPKVELVLTPDSISELGGVAMVTAELDHASSQVTTVRVSATAVLPAVAGDFGQNGMNLTIPAGATASNGRVTIEAVYNEVAAPAKRVTVSGTAENAQHVEDPDDVTLTITDNDSPSTAVTLRLSPAEVPEAEVSDVTVTAELNGATRTVVTEIPITVSAGTATVGADFAAVQSFTVTIPAGDKSATGHFTVAPVDDEMDEPAETVRVRGPSQASGLAVQPSSGLEVTIADDDDTPTVTLRVDPSSIGENDGSGSVTARLNTPSSQQTVVTVFATPVAPATAEDFRLRGDRLTIEAGTMMSTGSVTITGVDNDETDGNREVRVAGAAENELGIVQPEAVSANILDDELPPEMTAQNGEATGTIENSDLMPQAWLSRFGRTVAEQVLDAVEERIRSAPQAGVQVTVAGQRIGAAAAPSEEEAREAEAQARLEGFSTWLAGEAEAREKRTGSRSVVPREQLTGSSFALTTRADGIGGGLVSLWGRGVLTRFDGREGELSLSGEVTGTLLGADWTRDPGSGSGAGGWTMGLMLSHARGEGSYRGANSGKVSSTVTGLYPYGRYALTDRVTVWGTAGYGAGALTLTPEDGEALKTDMDLMMAAAGLRGTVVEAPPEGGPELVVKTDAMAVRTSSEATGGGAGGNLAAAEADVTRLRLGLEGTWRGLEIGTGTLVPRLEIGVRHDGGDAETGFGLDLGGGLAWSDPGTGLRAEVIGRGLLTHGSAGFRERGIAGSFGWDPTPGSDRGPSLTLSQTMGVSARGGADALLGRTTLAGLAANDNGDELERRRLELQLGYGYGFGTSGNRFTATPEVGFGMSAGHRDYSLAWRFVRDRRRGDIGSLEFSLEARRRESANDDAPPQHTVGLRLTAGF